MKEVIQSILVYVVIVSVLRGLITNPKYGQYFQFFSGIVMILLMLSPLLSLLQYEDTWYDILEENVLKMDLDEIKGEIKIADSSFQDVVQQEYVDTVEKQVTAMAQEKGIELEDVTVTLNQDSQEWQIAEITGKTNACSDTGDTDSRISIETIQIGQEKLEQDTKNTEDDSKTANALRQQISNYFVIGEDKVHLWK